MFQVGEKLYHAQYGAVTLEEISERCTQSACTTYYCLRPVFDEAPFYLTRVSALTQLAPLATADEAEALLACFDKPHTEWTALLPPHLFKTASVAQQHYLSLHSTASTSADLRLFSSCYRLVQTEVAAALDLPLEKAELLLRKALERLLAAQKEAK